MINEDRIIRREEWGAKDPPQGKPFFPHVPNKIIFHHYGFPEDEPRIHIMPFFDGKQDIKTLQKDDIKNLGLIDIKFHYVIAPNGEIYEGRPSQYMGKHTQSYDNGSIGVLVWGNFNVEEPTEEIKESMLWLCLFLRKKHTTINIPSAIYGHRCKGLTSCPGHNLYKFIVKMRSGLI
jgi:hypothetical protein